MRRRAHHPSSSSLSLIFSRSKGSRGGGEEKNWRGGFSIKADVEWFLWEFSKTDFSSDVDGSKGTRRKILYEKLMGQEKTGREEASGVFHHREKKEKFEIVFIKNRGRERESATKRKS